LGGGTINITADNLDVSGIKGGEEEKRKEKKRKRTSVSPFHLPLVIY
jgi:hypothetical protein